MSEVPLFLMREVPHTPSIYLRYRDYETKSVRCHQALIYDYLTHYIVIFQKYAFVIHFEGVGCRG